MKSAIIYLRTSDSRQKENTSLDTQEKIAKNYCLAEGLKVVSVVRREAVSAKDTNVTRVAELLEFAKENKDKFEVLVVFKLDRFARSQEHHHWLRGQLIKLGVYLRSATERIDESPSGRLIEGVLAAVNEYDNEVRKERVKLALWRRVDEGLWPWSPPDGYKREKLPNVRLSVSELDDACWLDFRRLFELYSTGKFNLETLAREANRMKIKNWKGQTLRFYRQRIQRLLNNLFYTGYLKNAEGKLIKAKHMPIIDMATYQKCQEVMKINTNHAVNKRLHLHPDFALKKFVYCGFCLKALTACWAKGRSDKYAYYYCVNKACEKYSKMVKKSDLEEEFYEYLKLIKPRDRFIDLFNETIIKRWEAEEQKLKSDYWEKTNHINELEQEQEWYIKKGRQGIIPDHLVKKNVDDLENKITLAKQDVSETHYQEMDVKGLLAYGKQFIQTAEIAWYDAIFEDRLKFQRMIFPEGVIYNFGGFLNRGLALPFKLIDDFASNLSSDVNSRGFEPLTPSTSKKCSTTELTVHSQQILL